MAVITPNTDLYLLKVPLEIDEVNQLTFNDKTAQYNYFNSLPKLTVDDFTYQRQDDTVRFGASFDDVITYNYCMYRNNEFSDKWFYAYITDVIWKSPNSTDIKIKTDVWQTWQFDLSYKPVFVEREHVNDDTVGLHTVPENLELGEYVNNNLIINSDYSPSETETNVSWICFQVSDYPDGTGALSPSIGTDVDGKIIGGVYSGLTYLLVLSPTDANELIACYDRADKADAIVSIFHVPLGIISADNLTITNHTDTLGNTITIGMFPSDNYAPINIEADTINKPANLNGYVPKCGKMLTYPYVYFYATNNVGGEAIYHFEDFDGNPTFNIDGTISQGMSIRAYPTNYKATTGLGGYNFGLSGGKLPICAWNSDYYTNWCTQNAINQPLGVFSTLATAGFGMLGGLLGGSGLTAASSAVSGFVGVLNAVDRRYQASLIPDQARGNENCGEINMAEKRFGFTFYSMSIKQEYAKICDDFMYMYGYKVNRVKLPNITGRRNWNFVKTQGCYIDADIPQTDLEEIKQMFNSGVTFWHNPATFADYSQNNDII